MMEGALNDPLGRPLRDLRISLTDRCNFRCRYCMPREVFGAAYPFLPHENLLTADEIARLAAVFVSLGARKLRLTGGEPLLRRDLADVVARLAAIPGVEDLALTTNGSLLTPAKCAELRDAGLRRVTVSLDALDDATFRRMNDVDFPVARVLAGIEAAHAAGLGPVKVNAVVQRGVNEDQVVPLARHFRGGDTVLRFIEYMDVGTTNGWRAGEIVPAGEIVAAIEGAGLPLVPLPAAYRGEVARRWRYADGGGEVGVVASMTEPFCGDCTRARLSAEGRLYTCLFAAEAAADLRAPLRSGATDGQVADAVRAVWSARSDRYSELRSARLGLSGEKGAPSFTSLPVLPAVRVEMSHIGG